MTNKLKILGIIIVVGLFPTGCEDMEFVEPDPTNLITQEAALSTLDGIEALVLSAYNRLISFDNYGQEMMILPDVLADNLELQSGTRYTGQIVNAVRSHLDILDDPGNPNGNDFTIRSSYSAYRAINECNIVISALSEEDGVASEDPDRAAILEGEAKFIRALSYHDLLRVYSYEPGREQNGFTQGVVLREDPILNSAEVDFLPRSSVEAGYERVFNDLNDAVSLLPSEDDTQGWPGRASSVAAQALRARVNLYAGNFAEAARDADAVLAATSAQLTSVTDYAASWGNTNHPEAIFELQVDAVDWNTVDGVNQSLATITRSSNFSSSSQGAVKASDELLAAYEVGDIRADLWVAGPTPDYFESTKWQGEAGDFRENIPIIRYSEVLLIAAEGKARSTSEGGARTDLDMLRSNRGIAGSVTATGQALIDLILNERRVELVLEGHRFFDLKRLGLTITKPADTGADDLLPGDFRIIAPFDENYVTISGVDQNPQY